MKFAAATALFVLCNALPTLSESSSEAAQARHIPSQRAGQTAHQMTSKGAAQNHQQWSADPERGWVRRDNAESAYERRSASKRHQQDRDQTRGKGKKS
jgi:hypothetical protein